MSGLTAAAFWLVLAIVLFVIEGFTVQLVSVWFAIGSICAMLASLIGADIYVQMIVFLIASVVVLPFGRPFLKKRLTPKKVSTNADMVIGMAGIVLVEIDNTLQTGRVSANGLEWSARCIDDRIVPVRQKVLVKAIEGVTLVIEPIENSEGV